MPTLEQIQVKIAKLQQQAEAIAAKQASAVPKEITSLMAANSISAADIDAFHAAKKPRGRPAGQVAAKKRGRPAKSSSGVPRSSP